MHCHVGTNALMPLVHGPCVRLRAHMNIKMLTHKHTQQTCSGLGRCSCTATHIRSHIYPNSVDVVYDETYIQTWPSRNLTTCLSRQRVWRALLRCAIRAGAQHEYALHQAQTDPLGAFALATNVRMHNLKNLEFEEFTQIAGRHSFYCTLNQKCAIPDDFCGHST
jgi:hypothetical protein